MKLPDHGPGPFDPAFRGTHGSELIEELPGARRGKRVLPFFGEPATHILIHEIVSATHDERSRRPEDTIALLKREEEQAALETPPAGGKLTHYREIQKMA